MNHKFVLQFRCDNDAFAVMPEAEVARILRDLADQIEQGFVFVYLRDANGNTVGTATFVEEE